MPALSKLAVFATIKPKPEFLEDAKQAILAIIPETRSEAGCHTFSLHEDKTQHGNLYLYEIWDDAAALEAHYAMPYTKKVFTAYQEWLAEPVAVTKMSIVK